MANSRLYEDLKKKIRGQVVVPDDAGRHRQPARLRREVCGAVRDVLGEYHGGAFF
jgi:hypothetical protein